MQQALSGPVRESERTTSFRYVRGFGFETNSVWHFSNCARNAEFQSLGKGPWALFIGIAVHRQGNAEAWPSQDTLSRFSGWSTRAVRGQADLLERAGFVRVRRERRSAGSVRIFYAPGLVTLAALANFVERFPRARAKVLWPDVPLPRTVEPTATHPGKPRQCPTRKRKLEHFLDHVERGRRQRLAAEHQERLRTSHDSASRAPPPPSAPPAESAVSHAQMKADLERLFGPGWRDPAGIPPG